MRISRQAMLMDMCEVIAKRSTCNRGNIGALVWDPIENDLVSIGYNGSNPHTPHCLDVGCLMEPGKLGCQRTRHAEDNAMQRAVAKLKNPNLGTHHLFCTSSPCRDCAEQMLHYRVGKLYYRHPYRDKSGIELLIGASTTLQIFRVMPNGIIISERTGNIIDSKDIVY